MSSFSCRLWRGCDSEMISLIRRRTAQISKTDHRNEAPGVCLMTLFLCDICFSAILYANELGRRRHLVSSSPSSQICFDNIDCLARDDNFIYMQQIWLWENPVMFHGRLVGLDGDERPYSDPAKPTHCSERQ